MCELVVFSLSISYNPNTTLPHRDSIISQIIHRLKFMHTISDIQKKYFHKINSLDLELLIAHTLEKPREFVLAHPEYKLPTTDNRRLTTLIKRRIEHEPLAYIVRRKEFFGLDFEVNKNTLIPRPETELLVELALQESRIKNQESIIVDIGTGSGCIIVSIATQLENKELGIENYNLYGTDISNDALKIAKQNAKKHSVDKKIKFIQGDLLNPIIKNSKLEIENSKIIIVANLPYLSKEIYSETSNDVKNFEPKSALYSPEQGLAHYKKLFKQIKNFSVIGCQLLVIFEISPEQKPLLEKIIPKYLSGAKIKFIKDLCGLWRVCKIET
jgi:release factor glutamine methyltransferase